MSIFLFSQWTLYMHWAGGGRECQHHHLCHQLWEPGGTWYYCPIGYRRLAYNVRCDHVLVYTHINTVPSMPPECSYVPIYNSQKELIMVDIYWAIADVSIANDIRWSKVIRSSLLESSYFCWTQSKCGELHYITGWNWYSRGLCQHCLSHGC